MADDGLNRRGFIAAAATLGLATWVGGASTARASDLDGLRSAIRGRVLLPGDPGFDIARKPWNLTVDQSVLAVAEVADATDAAALIRYARDAGLSVAAQPNGHGASDAVGGTILVRTRNLAEVRVDPDAQTATIGAGVSWGQVQAIAGESGLTGLAGSSPAVGVTGYTLGGGLSWFSRAYGWAAESVTAFDVIDADGRQRRATADDNPDLFWALRGGGGDFAFVTALEFRLKSAPAVYGGRISWPAAQASRVFAAFRDITSGAPDELTVWCGLISAPGAPPMVTVSTAYLGDAAVAQRLLAPLEALGSPLADTHRVVAVGDLGAIANEPTSPAPVRQRSVLLADLSEQTITALLAEPPNPLMFVQVRHLGGALARQSDIPTAPVSAPYLVTFGGIQPHPNAASAIEARVARYRDQLGSADTGRTLFNFLDADQSVGDALDATTLRRLQQIKHTRDPRGVFRSNYPVSI